MRHAATVFAVVLLSSWCLAAEQAADSRPGFELGTLPKNLTPAEAALPPLPLEIDGRVPPTGVVHCAAEYEPCDGLFIAWDGYTDVLTAMAVPITTNDPDATVYCVVDSTSEQSSAYSSLQSAGADMSQVEFIVRSTDTVWIRDYGPRFIFEDGQRAIVDHTYNRPRPNDNLLNDYIAQIWGEPQYQIPLTHGGGNFHLFANGDAFMTDLILDENAGLTEQAVIDLYADYQNVDLTIYPGFPTYFDSTQHIDMWMLPVDDYKIIVGQYSPSDGSPYTITENAVTDLESRGYTVYRTPGWNSGGTHYTYTNAVILNDQVFVPRFGGSYGAEDAQALAVFQAAFPNKTCIQVYCGSIIHAAGAIHCIVMHVPEATNPSIELLAPNGGELLNVGDTIDITWEASDNLGITAVDLYYSTDNGSTFPHEIALGEVDDGVYTWTVPPADSAFCVLRAVAHDADGNTATDDSDDVFTITYAREQVYNFPLDSDPGWTCEGDWAFGQPIGGGTHGGDPEAGYTGDNVYGYNLAGDYPNNMDRYHLTTTALDCRNVAQTEVRFWRWLGVHAYDHAGIEVSNDGVNWVTVWEHGGGSIIPSNWVERVYDISAVADGQPTVYIRWAMGSSNASITYPGWNIDDIEIWGLASAPPVCPGDANCDSVINWRDIDFFVAAQNNNESAWRAAFAPDEPTCAFLNNDVNADGDVSWRDIDPFVSLMNTTCP